MNPARHCANPRPQALTTTNDVPERVSEHYAPPKLANCQNRSSELNVNVQRARTCYWLLPLPMIPMFSAPAGGERKPSLLASFATARRIDFVCIWREVTS